jgi:hypothetical protein
MSQKENWQKNLNNVNHKSTLFFKKAYLQFSRFCYENQAIITAVIASLSALFYFILTAYPESVFKIFGFIRIRYFGIGSILFIFLTSAFSAVFLSNKWYTKISIWLQGSILIFFAFTYFLSIENSSFYPFAIAFFSSLIFIVFYDLFGEQKHYLIIRVIQTFLFSLQTFSLITFFSVDRSVARNIDIDALSAILEINEIYWILICSLAISLISVSSFGLKGVRNNVVFYSLMFILLFQTLILTNSLSFNKILYWHKTLILITIWDFIFLPLQTISNKIFDDKYRPKLIVSSFYHGLLLLTIFLISFYLI